MKKQLLTALAAILCLGLASCGGTETSSTEEESSVAESSTAEVSSEAGSSEEESSSADTYSLSVTYSGTAETGQTITLISTLYINGTQRAIADQENVTYTAADDASAELISISGFTAELLASGDCTINASYTYNEVVVSTEYTFTIAEGDYVGFTTIAEVKAVAQTLDSGSYSDSYYRIRGKVYATSGKSAYIADETGGIYVYNWSFNSSDTACSSYLWQVNTYVDVYGKVQRYGSVSEFVSYDGAYLDERYANLYSGEDFDIIESYELTEEHAEYLYSLNGNAEQIPYDGNPYNITCTYDSGTPNADTRTYLKFYIGEQLIELVQDANSSTMYDRYADDLVEAWEALGLEQGDTVRIENIPLYDIYNGYVTFHYFSQGTTITKVTTEA